MSNSPLVRDRQQAQVLAALRRADGSDVTYDELREEGLEYPATVISELELAGVPVGRGRCLQGVSWRLDPGYDPVSTDSPTEEFDALSEPDAAPPPEPVQPRAEPVKPRPEPVQTWPPGTGPCAVGAGLLPQQTTWRR
jgi:hypothetical protein